MNLRIDWRKSGVPVLLLATTALLVVGLTLPALRLDKLVSSKAHSILGGIYDLWISGRVFLGIVILAFSVLFPTVKLLALIVLHTQDVEDEAGKLDWLRVLGKWSMVDVYVVTIFVGAVRLGILAEFVAEPGIYVFAGSILLTMIATHVMAALRGLRCELRPTPAPSLRSLPERLLSIAAAVTFVAGASLPLMEVEKWLFWSDEKSLVEALGALIEEEHAALGLLLAFFVLVMPGIQLVGVLVARWVPHLTRRFARALLAIEEWAMLDVFAVAVLIVVSQLAGMAAISPRRGLWFLLAAALLSAVDARRLRSALVQS